MKQFFRTVAEKSILFVSCMIALVVTLTSVIAAGRMIQAGFYTKTRDEIFDDFLYGRVRSQIEHTLEKYASQIKHLSQRKVSRNSKEER